MLVGMLRRRTAPVLPSRAAQWHGESASGEPAARPRALVCSCRRAAQNLCDKSFAERAALGWNEHDGHYSGRAHARQMAEVVAGWMLSDRRTQVQGSARLDGDSAWPRNAQLMTRTFG
jgi:hypothetical protein